MSNKVVGISLLLAGSGLITYAFLRKEKKIAISNIDSYIEYLEKNTTEQSANCILLQDEFQKATDELKAINNSKSALTSEVALKKSLLEIRKPKLQSLINKYGCGTYSDISNCSDLKKKMDDLELKIRLEKDCSANSICALYKGQLVAYKKAYSASKCSVYSDKYSPQEISECAIIDEDIKYYMGAKNLKSASDSELKFTNLNCRDKIEYQRQKTSASIFSKGAESAETDVLGKSSTEEYVYIGIGGLIILSGLLIVIRK